MRLDDVALTNSATPSPAAGIGAPNYDPTNSSLGLDSSSNSGSNFKQTLEEAQLIRTVQPGDNLISIVRQQAQSQGLLLTDSQALHWARELATSNGMTNANRIYPGQQLNLNAISSQWRNSASAGSASSSSTDLASIASSSSSAPPATSTANSTSNSAPMIGAGSSSAPLPTTAAVLSAKMTLQSLVSTRPVTPYSSLLPSRASNATIPKSSAPANVNVSAGANILSTQHPVLDKTLDRAVAKGFIPAAEKQAVYQKVLQMANKFGFAPDDFARMTLMESDGMNPKASNQRCHGIIQFCDGPARGAAAVGMGNDPKSILNLSVYQQLHLADTYFQKAGLNKQQGSVPLDDLYLSVLHPSARSETRSNAPLGIPGTQAGALYGDKNSNAITRQSLIRGLIQNAQHVLGLDRAQNKAADNRAQSFAPSLPGQGSSSSNLNTSRIQAQRVASYEAPDSSQQR